MSNTQENLEIPHQVRADPSEEEEDRGLF